MFKRTGITAFTRLTVQMCNLLHVWKPKIISFVQSADHISNADKSAIIQSIDTIDSACEAYKALVVLLEQ